MGRMVVDTNNDDGEIILKEVYGGVGFQNSTGEKLSVCMRDDGFMVGSAEKVEGGTNVHWYFVRGKDMTFDHTVFCKDKTCCDEHCNCKGRENG